MYTGRLFTVKYSETLPCFTIILICVKHPIVLFARDSSSDLGTLYYYCLLSVYLRSDFVIFSCSYLMSVINNHKTQLRVHSQAEIMR